MELNSLEMISNDPKSTEQEQYLKKLDKCLFLILNDEPDHRDDTIISKLHDSLQSQLDMTNKESTILLSRLRKFVEEDILEVDLDSKEHDVTKFFLDLITLTLKSTSGDYAAYLNRILTALDAYIVNSSNGNVLSLDSSVLISLIRLMIQLDDNSKSLDSPTLLNQLESRIHSHFLHETNEFLNFDAQSSIYLRKEFKTFYVNRLKRGHTLIESITWSNMDVVCDWIKFGLISADVGESRLILEKNSDDDIISRLKLLGEEFSQRQMEFLMSSENSIKNETQIEAFAWMNGFSVLLSFISPSEMDQYLNQKETLLNEKFNKTLNKICNHFATLPENENNTAKESTRQLRNRLNIMFKLMIAFHSFLNNDEISSSCFNHLLEFDFRPSREALKLKITQHLVSSLYVKLNNSNSPTVIENYLLLLNELSFDHRKLALAQGVSSLRQFTRKFQPFAAKMLQFVESNQIIYLLKHVNLENSFKPELLNLMSDVFSTISVLNSSQADYLMHLFQYVETNLDIDQDNLTSAQFRLISECLAKLINRPIDLERLASRLISLIAPNNTRGLAELNCMQLQIIGCESKEPSPELAKLTRLIEFLIDLLCKNPNDFKFDLVMKVLKSDDYRMLKTCLNFLLAEQDEFIAAIESLNDLRQYIYQLLSALFKFITFKSTPIELSPLTESTIQMVEKRVSKETEAFVRREMIAFLSSYYLNQNKYSITLFNSINFFSRTLASDLDWEVQLNCVVHLSHVIRSVTSDLDTYAKLRHEHRDKNQTDDFSNVSSKFTHQLDRANPIEIVFVHSDCLPTLVHIVNDESCYDRSVVGAVAELLIELKQNDVLTSVLASLDRLTSISTESLETILAETKLSSDLYSRQPLAILDDIISSYQFDMDDEKAVDCY